MRSIKQIKNLRGKTILLRAGFDVPIKDGKVIDSKRIKILLPTIKYLMNKGPLVILSHQGRPKGRRDMAFTQKPLIPVLGKLLRKKIKFASSCIGVETEKMAKSLKKGEVLLLENLRFEPGEEKNDLIFAKELSKLGDVYVDDAFPDAHRKHASIVGIPKYLPSYVGFQFLKEIEYLSLVFKKTKHPFLLILGGAKFETKLPIIKRFLKTADNVFIGGALANQVFKEEGYEVGYSLVENKKYNLPLIIRNPKIMLPNDVLVLSEGKKQITLPNNVSKKENIVDVGPKTIKDLEIKIKKAKIILWNGPLGESSSGFDIGTEKIVRAIAKTKIISIVGGGDTSEVISKLKLENKFTFISTGGGATLEYLAKGTLPGIKALK
ncbi:MAG: phosphoglycerate kinase [Candidatus Nomurabacteria bacterium]|nr:phosphoglycerate kinase [Candidatus Nomurabacteria bacterium]